MSARLISLICFVLMLLAGKVCSAAPALIPLPQSMQLGTGVFTLCPPQAVAGVPVKATTKILTDTTSKATGQYLAALLLKSTGYEFEVSASTSAIAVKDAILITTVNSNATLNSEGYELTVSPDSVVIRAPTSAGGFYGVQTLLQLFPPQIYSVQPAINVTWTAPCVFIQDQPRFAWRGFMLDVVRHFHDKQEVKDCLDTMAYHKLNTFHWHLVDDQAWRIQILQYPRLTSVSAWRPSIDYGLNPRATPYYDTNGNYGGFYTQDDIREVVAYAAARHITIVPEVEMPGHSTAALLAYPAVSADTNFPINLDVINYHYDVYSPATPGTFTFLQNVLTEVMGLFPGQYIHCGGDEVSSFIWNTNAYDSAQMQTLGITPNGSASVLQYQSWFSGQIANFLASKGRTMIGWTEIEYGGVLTNAALMDWINGSSSQAVNAATNGRPVVMGLNAYTYMNYLSYTNQAVEPPSQSGTLQIDTMYNFEPVPTNLPAAYVTNILGAQGQLWGEYVPSRLNMFFKLYPRLCALSEVLWTPAALKNYTNFQQRLVAHKQRLDSARINYDHTNLVQIGSWSSTTINTNGVTNSWDVSSYVTNAGEVDINFWRNTGNSSLNINWVALLENGVEIDRDVHTGTATTTPIIPIYILHVPARKRGATYTIRANMAGSGGTNGTNSTGTVYMPNWN